MKRLTSVECKVPQTIPPDYVLTPDAERDLREVARYTLRQWGAWQQRRCASLLEAGFRAIAQRRIVPRVFSPNYPDVCVSRLRASLHLLCAS
jgi:plasmid stabilization system protein ParE